MKQLCTFLLLLLCLQAWGGQVQFEDSSVFDLTSFQAKPKDLDAFKLEFANNSVTYNHDGLYSFILELSSCERQIAKLEFAALKIYSSNCCYQKINADLRVNGSVRTTWKHTILAISSGLQRLTAHDEDILFRGIQPPPGITLPYFTESVVTELAFTSFSRKLSLAVNFGKGDPYGVLLVGRKLKSAKSIQLFSQYSHEEEYLLPPRSILKVIGREDRMFLGEKFIVFYVYEVRNNNIKSHQKEAKYLSELRGALQQQQSQVRKLITRATLRDIQAKRSSLASQQKLLAKIAFDYDTFNRDNFGDDSMVNSRQLLDKYMAGLLQYPQQTRSLRVTQDSNMPTSSNTSVPATWICHPSFYNSNDGCDCNCGAWDPDCAQPLSSVSNCNNGSSPQCDASGKCIYQSIPSGWTCDPARYNASDGCDCNCGIIDPDCNTQNPYQMKIFGCSNENAKCVNGKCVQTLDPPSDWLCEPSWYASNDGCDCNCGAIDPDCLQSPTPVFNCPCENMTCFSGLCLGKCGGYNINIESGQALANPTVPFTLWLLVACFALLIM